MKSTVQHAVKLQIVPKERADGDRDEVEVEVEGESEESVGGTVLSGGSDIAQVGTLVQCSPYAFAEPPFASDSHEL